MDCDVEFAYDFAFTTATAIVEFILPCIGLTSINAVLYYKLRQRLKVNRSVNAQRFTLQPSPAGTNDETSLTGTNDETSPTGTNDETSLTGTNDSISKDNDDRVQSSNEADNPEEPNNSINHPQAIPNDTGKKNLANRPKDSERKTEAQSRRHVKAAKFLAALVVAFLILWGPYTVTTVIVSFCNNCVNLSLYEFFTWMLWVKSAVNPFLYAFNSPRYRKHFTRYVTLNNRLYKPNPMESSRLNTTTLTDHLR
jgi:hypothetical protein